MLTAASDNVSFSMVLPDEQATGRLMLDIAAVLEPGDFVTLSGDLGAGKTTLARALIRHLAGDEGFEVPSPSFTLMQIYQLPRFPLVHADLYRISGATEFEELGFEDLPDDAVIVLEWPDRAAGFLPPDRLDITLTLAPKLKIEFRHARITGYGTFAPRVERMAAVRQFIAESDYGEAQRQRLVGDASTRIYERLRLDRKRAILMNAPQRPDGPPVRDGKPYSAIAHLAEDVVPFVAFAKGLRDQGFSTPRIYYADLAQGLLLIEDLGDQRIVAGDPPLPIPERYEVAVDALLALHERRLPDLLPVAPHVEYRVPRYDLDAFLIEAELLLDWYLPHRGLEISAAAGERYVSLWRDALMPAVESPPTWVLRDFHSPNLLWLPDRSDVARIGILDFQDALMGPAAYDLASLLQDARIDVPAATEIELLGRYLRRRRAADPGFNAGEFIGIYVTVAAQRASKILGIFARLERRDGKPQYLRHMPRIWNYLQRSLAHPALAPLAEWFAEHIPDSGTADRQPTAAPGHDPGSREPDPANDAEPS
jgi:tRNA threonylcarbamoyl adenosine modification protein YjeE